MAFPDFVFKNKIDLEKSLFVFVPSCWTPGFSLFSFYWFFPVSQIRMFEKTFLFSWFSLLSSQ